MTDENACEEDSGFCPIELTKQDRELLTNLRSRHAELVELYKDVNYMGYEDGIYRFYHGSFKVYYLQPLTIRIVDVLRQLAPDGTTLSSRFEEIYQAGAASEKQWERAHNRVWNSHARPLVEAFCHARYFLEMAVRFGAADQMNEPIYFLPSGFAALLTLYGIR
ncbi:MAG: hypothetical protein KJ558_11370 [Gammaproteobacteria bacterium]|nr:hypothetical protein [Gammaproteobacteria bacterium]MBU1655407.1 hypothetical protein [Gammaproteobacteria bacterium]MBU1960815.1 hypothetical protein [Gammaproteobacteria bacterium]